MFRTTYRRLLWSPTGLLLLLSLRGSSAAIDKKVTTKEQSVNFDPSVLKNLPKPKARIVGGHTVQQGSYPFFAQWMKGCGGSLIHDDIVLTAGHCLTDVNALWYEIYIGGQTSGSGEKRSIVDYRRHPRYDFESEKAYDFLVLKLDQPVQNPQFVQLNQDPHYPSSDEMFTVIGFGYTHEDGDQTSEYLQEVQVPHIPDCSPYYSQGKIQDTVAFCAGEIAGGRDACQADSGGALLNPTNNLQIGLVSWGRGCGRPESPGVYARVSTAYSWIQHQICELSAVPPSHCVKIRVDITMDTYPLETEWALLDRYGHEMVLSRRESVDQSGLVTYNLSIPAGSYRFYMSDPDGICCEWGGGGIKIYSGDTADNQILSHNGVFDQELMLNLEVGTQTQLNEQESSTPTQVPSSPANTPAPAPSIQTDPGSYEIVLSTLRVEIFYDTHPEETGWFLVNTDTSKEVYATEYDEDNKIPQNANKKLTLVVEEFPNLVAGNYWFVIADSAMNGLCCEGYVRIVQVFFYEYSQEVERAETVEERVVWEHNGQFQAFAETHFTI